MSINLSTDTALVWHSNLASAKKFGYNKVSESFKEENSAMSTPIKPLADRVVAVREAAQEKTASGLYLPDTAKEKPTTATVEAIGPEVKSLKIGDKIVYKEYTTTEMKINGKDYLIVKEEDVLATVA